MTKETKENQGHSNLIMDLAIDGNRDDQPVPSKLMNGFKAWKRREKVEENQRVLKDTEDRLADDMVKMIANHLRGYVTDMVEESFNEGAPTQEYDDEENELLLSYGLPEIDYATGEMSSQSSNIRENAFSAALLKIRDEIDNTLKTLANPEAK